MFEGDNGGRDFIRNCDSKAFSVNGRRSDSGLKRRSQKLDEPSHCVKKFNVSFLGCHLRQRLSSHSSVAKCSVNLAPERVT
jgi:hypothetical protein